MIAWYRSSWLSQKGSGGFCTSANTSYYILHHYRSRLQWWICFNGNIKRTQSHYVVGCFLQVCSDKVCNSNASLCASIQDNLFETRDIGWYYNEDALRIWNDNRSQVCRESAIIYVHTERNGRDILELIHEFGCHNKGQVQEIHNWIYFIIYWQMIYLMTNVVFWDVTPCDFSGTDGSEERIVSIIKVLRANTFLRNIGSYNTHKT
jgi:hypothetical protein